MKFLSPKNCRSPKVTGLLAAALLPLSALGAVNTWNNASGDFFWNSTSPNWTGPTRWSDGDDAIFGAAGVGSVDLASPVIVGDLTFNADGYTIMTTSGNVLSLGNGLVVPAITANNSVIISASIQGTNGLTIQGSTNVTFLGDVNAGVANQYTGGTFVRGGRLILQCANANTSGTSYGVDSIEALDAGATVVIPATFNGTTWVSQRDQIAASAVGSHLKMTGGTLDLYNDPKNQRIPVPEGSGLIINTGPDVQAGLLMIADGQNHTFSGIIADGGPLVGNNTGQGPGHQIGIVSFSGSKNGGGGELTLSGPNTYSGSTRIDQGASIKLEGAGTLGNPSDNGLTGPLRVYGPGHLDLNGTSQTIALMTGGNTTGQIYNSAEGTVSTLTFGYGNEQASRNANMQFIDNPGTGGILALTKIGTNCAQTLSGVNTYSGDTTVREGILIFTTTTAVSPNSRFRLFTTGGVLQLNYTGDTTVRGLFIDGVRMPPGTYGASTAPIKGTGTITVPAPNTWNNASNDSLWNTTSANWTSPTTWANGSDAVFGAAGAGTVSLGAPIVAELITFNAPGYTLDAGTGGNTLTLGGATPTITANANVTNATSLLGNAGLTVQGTSELWLLGETVNPDGNHYTGGTYVKSGTLVLRAQSAVASGLSYGVDRVEAVDPGAILKFGTLNDGQDQSTSISKTANGQITTQGSVSPHRLNLTGGTFDLNGDDNQNQVPQPSGTGTIINTSPYARGVLKFTSYGGTTTFSGSIKDGGTTIARANNGPGFQMNIDSQSGTAGTLILAGSNSFSGFVRIGNGGTIRLSGAGTLGYPAPINCAARQIIQNNGVIDLNGTSQKTGFFNAAASAAITNSAAGTLSVLTLCYNCTNLTVPSQGGINCSLQDDSAAGTLIGVVKEGIAIQPLNGPANNYHGDTVVNNGTLRIDQAGAVSPNSTYRLSASKGTLALAFTGTTPVKRLVIDGVEMPNGVYGATTAPITGTGFIQVTGSIARPNLGFSVSGGGLVFSWSGSFKLQSQTNSLSTGLAGSWFDYPGGGVSPTTVPLDNSRGSVFFRLAPLP